VEEIVRLLKLDRDALRELAVAVTSEPEVRLPMINAVLAYVTTKQDTQQLRQETSMLRQRVDNGISQLRWDFNTNLA
jgi:hypothetical protein